MLFRSHFTLIQHTAAAVNDELISGDVFREFSAGGEVEVWLLSGIFPDPVWEFSGTDIAALAVMGATLGDQDLIAILDAVQRPCAVDGLGEISFVPRKENRE